MGREKITITPDHIRNPQIEKLEKEIVRAKWMRWILLFIGLIAGALISWFMS